MDKFPFYCEQAETCGTKRKRVSKRQSQIGINSGLGSTTVQASPRINARAESQCMSGEAPASGGDSTTPVQDLSAHECQVLHTTEMPGTSTTKRNRVSKRQVQILTDSKLGKAAQPSSKQTEVPPKTPRRKGKKQAMVNGSQAPLEKVMKPVDHVSHNCSEQPETSGVMRKRFPVVQPQVSENRSCRPPSAAVNPIMNKRRTKPKSRHTTRIQTATIGAALPAGKHFFPEVDSCQKCGARKLLYETQNFCCGNGAVLLPTNAYPPS